MYRTRETSGKQGVGSLVSTICLIYKLYYTKKHRDGDVFMPRRPREIKKTGTYHVMIRCANKQEIFHDNEDRLKLGISP